MLLTIPGEMVSLLPGSFNASPLTLRIIRRYFGLGVGFDIKGIVNTKRRLFIKLELSETRACSGEGDGAESLAFMSNKRSGCLWFALVIVLCVSLLVNVGLVAGKGKRISSELQGKLAKPERLEERVLRSGTGRDRIVVIPVRGLISSNVSGRIGASMVEDIKIQLRQAEEDDRVKAVVLAIDSPGGEVTASDILYNAVRRVRDHKPVVVSMGSMATSGGYYTACGGSYLMAHPTTFTGSIGVIIQSLRYNDLLGKIGIAPVTFKSGAFKDLSLIHI